MTRPRFARATLVFVGALAATVTGRALAEDSAVGAAADTLFRQGSELYEAKNFAQACPKFAESYRLDPASGSLIALASCHEAQGKLASAWSEYNDATALARREGQAARAEQAKQRAAVLAPKLAKLNIVLARGSDVPGLVVKRDGIVIASGGLGTALPVDRGEHVVEASAPGFQPFSKTVRLADGAALTLTIPRLTASSRATEAPATAPTTSPEQPPSPPPVSAPATSPATTTTDGSPFPLRTVGVGVIAAGAVAGGIATFFGIQALGKNADSNSDNHCVNDVCDVVGTQRRRDALSAGNTSTALFIVGGALVAGGVVLYVVGAPKAESKPAIAASPTVGPGSGGFALSGRF